MRAIGRALALASALTALLLPAGGAQAAFPGTSGRIGYTSGSSHVATVDPQGLTKVFVADDGGNPAFSPDGSRIAFLSNGHINTIGQYGEDRQSIAPAWSASDVEWSPTGNQLVAVIHSCAGGPPCPGDLYGMNSNGTAMVNITQTPAASERSPSWSPDGTKILFERDQDIYAVNPDGSGESNLTAANPRAVQRPDWSPDGSRIAYIGGIQPNASVFTMNADGSGEAVVLEQTDAGSMVPLWATEVAWSPDGTQLTYEANGIARIPVDGGRRINVVGNGTGILGVDLDWQPLSSEPTPPPTGSGYPRPRSASPVRVALVVAYQPCPRPDRPNQSPNRVHGPPLAFPSCSPPVQSSGLRVGTPDANGLPAEAVGSVLFESVVGNPATPEDEADVLIRVNQTDVRTGGTSLADFGGPLKAQIPLRVTDKFSAGGPDASATMMDIPLAFTVQCAVTPNDSAGGSCQLDTTVDAITPGTVREGKRTIWELGQVELRYQPAPNDPSRDRVFLRQGVFVP